MSHTLHQRGGTHHNEFRGDQHVGVSLHPQAFSGRRNPLTLTIREVSISPFFRKISTTGYNQAVFAVCFVCAGIIAMALRGLSLVNPLQWLEISTRGEAALVLAVGLFIMGPGWAFPTKQIHVASIATRLDYFAPTYQFNEVHSIKVAASRDGVFQAIKAVTADEILFFRTLTWIRRFGRPCPESILNAPPRVPILEVATRTGFVLLAEEPNREIVAGTAVAAPPGWHAGVPFTPGAYKAVSGPGFALATMNFLIEDAGPELCEVTTETRVYATDESTRRRFAIYWRTIYPGSALMRRMWLRAIKRRAEARTL